LSFAVPLDPVPSADDTLELGVDTGGYLVGTVVTAADDGSAVEVTFPGGTDLPACDQFTTVFCNDTRGCSAVVQSYEVNCSNNHYVDLTLANPIKADASDLVTLYYGDGTVLTALAVITANQETLVYTINTGAVFCDNVGGVVAVCVPATTDASCPACGGATFTQCTT
jgi:hypothetical protein